MLGAASSSADVDAATNALNAPSAEWALSLPMGEGEKAILLVMDCTLRPTIRNQTGATQIHSPGLPDFGLLR